MRRNLEEIQNYLEFLYNNIDDETEKVEISVEVFEDLREFFNACICVLASSTQIQGNISLATLVSLAINLILVLIFIFEI